MLVLLFLLLIDWTEIYILLLLFSIFAVVVVMCLVIKNFLKIISKG